MKQRAAIARALVHRPPLLMMDEPFGALDALTREQMRIDLERIWLSTRKTVVFITHSIDEAVLLSDRVVVMTPRPGRLETTLDIPLKRPRGVAARRDPAFIEAVEAITEIFLARGVLHRDPDMRTLDRLDAILAETRGVFAAMPEDAVPGLADDILGARRVALYGVGRTGSPSRALRCASPISASTPTSSARSSAPPIGPGRPLRRRARRRAACRPATPSSPAHAGRGRGSPSSPPRRRRSKAPTASSTCRPHDGGPALRRPAARQRLRARARPPLRPDVVELMERLGRSGADLARRHANLL